MKISGNAFAVFLFLSIYTCLPTSAKENPVVPPAEVAIDFLSSANFCKAVLQMQPELPDRLVAEFSDSPAKCKRNAASFDSVGCKESLSFRSDSFGLFAESVGPGLNVSPFLSSILAWREVFESVTKSKFNAEINQRDQSRQLLFSLLSDDSKHLANSNFVAEYISPPQFEYTDVRANLFQDVIGGPSTSCRSLSYIAATGEILHTHVYLKSEPDSEAINMCVLGGYLGAFGVGNFDMSSSDSGKTSLDYLNYLIDVKIFYEILLQHNFFAAGNQVEDEIFDIEKEVESAVAGICR
jgi:hypothetical protein